MIELCSVLKILQLLLSIASTCAYTRHTVMHCQQARHTLDTLQCIVSKHGANKSLWQSPHRAAQAETLKFTGQPRQKHTCTRAGQPSKCRDETQDSQTPKKTDYGGGYAANANGPRRRLCGKCKGK